MVRNAVLGSPITNHPKVLRDSKSFKTNVVRIGMQSWKMFSGPKFLDGGNGCGLEELKVLGFRASRCLRV